MRLLLLFAALLAPPAMANDSAAGRVIAVYPDRNSTKLVIETQVPLVAGAVVYAGPDEVEATLGDALSRSGGLYYYSASIPGNTDVKTGDEVVTGRNRIQTPNPLRLKISESYTFEQKRKGEVTAVQDGRAMIDRGTLHEVRERDLYRVYGPDRRYKGMLEIRGIGDLQSSGILYNALEDRRRDAERVSPGDRVVFAGQRKLFALGLMAGSTAGAERVLGRKERAIATGLVWDLMFRDGWGFEALFGLYDRDVTAHRAAGTRSFGQEYLEEDMDRSARFLAPIWLKKNFWFPSAISPFGGFGFSLFQGRLKYRRFHTSSLGVTTFTEDEDTSLAPALMLGGGIDFFPARFLRPRFEVRWLRAPTLKAGSASFDATALFYSVSVLTAW